MLGSPPPPSGLRPGHVRPTFGLALYDSATFCTCPLFSSEKPQTAEPAVCATRLFDLVLCFHRHSRFVPSNSSQAVESRELKVEA